MRIGQFLVVNIPHLCGCACLSDGIVSRLIAKVSLGWPKPKSAASPKKLEVARAERFDPSSLSLARLPSPANFLLRGRPTGVRNPNNYTRIAFRSDLLRRHQHQHPPTSSHTKWLRFSQLVSASLPPHSSYATPIRHGLCASHTNIS